METLTEDIPTTFSFDKTYSIEEYLEIEDTSIEKHEFYNGKIKKMAGAKPAHNIIAANIIAQLVNVTENKELEYFVLNSDSKIRIERFNSFVYPDAVVVCEAIEMYPGSTTVIMNPLLIVEVLSPSTEEHDRTTKFFEYQQIPSFKEYLRIDQKIPFVIASFKAAEHTWQNTEAKGLESSIYLKSIDCTIDLKKIYRGIKF
jgi:Uma2 family endonuclease